MTTTLILTEKKKAAAELVRFFPKPHVDRGLYWEADSGRIKIAFAQGHLLSQFEPGDYDEKWKKWDMKSLPVLPNDWRNKPDPKTAHLLKNIKMLLSEADQIIHAGDAEREGQLIIDEVLDFFKVKKPVMRLWLSAMTQKDFDHAYKNMKNNAEYAPIKEAGQGRQRADFTTGMTFTRFLTLAFQKAGYEGVKSAGRVQTPIVNIVYMRNKQIENFTPQAYLTIHGKFEDQNKKHPPFWTRWLPAGIDANMKTPEDGVDPVEIEDDEDEDEVTTSASAPAWLLKPNRILDPAKAEEILAEIKNEKSGVVAKFDKKAGKEKPPKLLELNDLQIAMNKKYGYTGAQTLEIAQSLYQKGYMSYPRTDSKYLPESIYPEIPQMLSSVASLGGRFEQLAQGADGTQKGACFNDKGVSDHYALVPTVEAPKDLTSDEQKVYEHVALIFLANFYPDCDVIKVNLEILVGANKHRFVTSGRSVVNPGWRVVFAKEETDSAKNKNTEESDNLPVFNIGDVVSLIEIKKEEGKTKPPPYFTEATLLTALANVYRLEKDPDARKKLKSLKGIGRPATRSDSIKTNFARNYFELQGKYIMHTPVAELALKSLPPELIEPALTARWEQALDSIQNKKVALSLFEQRQAAWIQQIFDKIKDNVTIPQAPPGMGKATYSSSGKSSKGSSGASAGKGKGSSSSSAAKGKTCPTCKKGHLVSKEIKAGAHAGKKFKGCSEYPACKHTEWPKK